MQPASFLIASLISGLGLKDVLLSSAAIIGPLLGFFAARFTALARLERTLLDASRQWVEDSQKRHAADGVLISGQADELLRAKAEVLRQRGEIDAKIQENESLRHFMRRNQLEPPPRFPTIREADDG